MFLTLRINAVWLLTWVQPNTGDYKTINEVNGTWLSIGSGGASLNLLPE